MLWCPDVDTCNEVIELHRYLQARPRSQDIWSAGYPIIFDRRFEKSAVDNWCDIQPIDEVLFSACGLPHLSLLPPLFRHILTNLITTGRLVVTSQTQLAALIEDLDKRRILHDAFHGEACERVLNEWECSAKRPIEAGDAL
ncbi:hypothetical protein FZEAL_4818, partial [Fusarium zealandicum]